MSNAYHNERSGLLGGNGHQQSQNGDVLAGSMSGPLGMVIGGLQVVACAVLVAMFRYDDDAASFTTEKYIIFRDIMVMLLLGFGFLMTFLKKYGLGAVGFTMLLTALNMECNLIVEGALNHYYSDDKSPLVISMDRIIDSEFSAATMLISFGALIGRASPLSMCFVSIFEAVFYAINKVVIVFGLLEAEDVGGTITIHMFGAYFGLAYAYALGPQRKRESAESNNCSSRVSDVFSFVGTTLLWVYWPSFVGATETDTPTNEMHCLINTIMALVGSTGASFFLSQYLNKGKFDAVHIQNSTLAGGVAIGTTARLAMGPGVALIVGVAAGLVSVLGYFYSSPFLEQKFGIFDTCGVANLHGYPSVLGGLLSIVLVHVVDSDDAPFLVYGSGTMTQSLIQLKAVGATLGVAIVSGFVSGKIIDSCLLAGFASSHANANDYDDAIWWIDVE